MQFDRGGTSSDRSRTVDLPSHRNFWSTLEFNSVGPGVGITVPAGRIVRDQEVTDSKGGPKMRYLRIAGIAGLLVAVCLLGAGNANAQRVAVGVGFGGPGYGGYDYGYGAPVCAYGYYGYAPYACAPYGYYGPDWFVGGVFIGAGPWFRGGYYGRGFYGRGFYGRGYYGRGY